MQLQIVLILLSLNFCKISTKNESNSNLVKTTPKLTKNSDIADTPSPEWIKYQEERFQNSDKLTSTYQNIMKTNVQPKVSVELSNMATISRHEQPQEEDIQQVVFENNNSGATAAVEFPSIQGFIAFVKSVKHTWVKNSLFRFDDKIKMLHQLKDSLLKAIEQQFMILWEDDEGDDEIDTSAGENRKARKVHNNKYGRHLRSKRGILGESNLNFPPNAALMSINFLTFAVFLIKLVLQVVNIVKSKHYQFSSFQQIQDTGAIRNG